MGEAQSPSRASRPFGTPASSAPGVSVFGMMVLQIAETSAKRLAGNCFFPSATGAANAPILATVEDAPIINMTRWISIRRLRCSNGGISVLLTGVAQCDAWLSRDCRAANEAGGRRNDGRWRMANTGGAIVTTPAPSSIWRRFSRHHLRQALHRGTPHFSATAGAVPPQPGSLPPIAQLIAPCSNERFCGSV